ncbi:MAG: GNAT family N-acetyltransferase [Parvibaculum sp.]|nr:GNAT family N-acetyltransferase [Parvibaculum sp.]
MATITSRWRSMTAADIPVVDAIGVVVHPGFPEDIAVMENRFGLFGAGCFVADNDDKAIGYAIAHPSKIGRPAPLNTVLPALDANADCLFLHDIALTNAARGQGLGVAIVPLLKNVARTHGFAKLGLVSVNNSRAFWSAQGFEILAGDDTLKAKLATYEDDACFMVLDVG